MSSRARELLERARAANVLDAPASERISNSVLEKLSRGESALPGIDASPLVLPKLSVWSVLWSSSGIKTIMLLGAGVMSVATLSGLHPRAQPDGSPTQPVLLPAPSRHELALPATPSVALRQHERSGPADEAANVRLRPVLPDAAHSDAAASPPRAASAATKKVARVEGLRAKPTARAQKLKHVEPAPRDPSADALDPELRSERLPRAPTSKAAATSAQLDAELGLLRRAYAQLHAGKPGDAQDLLDEHAQRFPRGALAEPREVAQIIVLCKLNREREARAHAGSFLALHPKSPFAERVRSVCSDTNH